MPGQSDPMSDTRAAWDEVGSKFSGLGTKLRYHFEQARSEGSAPAGGGPGTKAPAAGEPAAGEPATSEPARTEPVTSEPTGAGTPQSGPEGADGGGGAGPEVMEALRKFGDALDGAFEALGNAARDQAVKEDLRQVGQSLAGALSSTFNDAGEELRKAFRRGKE